MPQFCAQYSQAVGEPLAGTGTHKDRNLLLSWPIGQWTRTFHQARDMSEAVSERMRALNESGRRVNLIHRGAQRAGWHRAYLMPEQQAYDIPRAELDAFLAAVQAERSLDAWHSGPVSQRVVLCCTHGVKDRCCAKSGNARYKALTEAARQYAGEFEIWQSTHLGGCRLASAALVFPALHKYGRIQPEDVEPLLASERQDRPYLPCYRGAATLTPVQQVAEVEARRRLAERGVYPSRLTVLSERSLDDAHRVVDLRWETATGSEALSLTLSALAVDRFGTCADIDEGLSPDRHETWVPT